MGFSIFGFKTYCEQVFHLMEIQTTQTFKQLLQAETLNADENKSYYQRYNAKRLRAFHRQAMIKQQIYDNILARRNRMDYSPGTQFETSLINMEGAKELTMNNQLEKQQQTRCQCGSIKHSRVSSNDCSLGLAIRKSKNWPWGWGYINPKQRRQQNMQQQRKKSNFWR